MKAITLAAIVMLCGCGTNAYQAQQQADPNYAQCEYEASVATANMPSDSWDAIFKKGELLRKCLAMKGGK